ncbi:MAG TPA: ATP-binding protein [Gemmatimonadaceae bacterium]
MTAARRLRDASLWFAVLAATTATMVPFRADLDKAHIALVLLLVVLGAGAQGGRMLGVGIGLASFLVFDWYFLSPFHTLVVANPLDWVVLIAFLVTSIVAAQLLHREQESARVARARADEINRLSANLAHVDALREADRLKDALLASVSHDLRTPLTTIKALAHELGALGDERSQIIEEQADRLNRVVADLLDLSRLSAGAMPVHLELNAVDDLLSAAFQDTEGRLAGHELTAVLPNDSVLLVGRFDISLSIRVLVNLIDNAIKYSSPATTIRVAARRNGATLDVSVSDTGPGVPPGEDERIFTPFYRPPGERPDVGSAGLGLAIARQMAQSQGGNVTYARRTDGSTFTLVLQAADVTG